MSAASLPPPPPAPRHALRFRSDQHLRRQADIRRVRVEGRRIDCGAFTLWWRRTPGAAGPARAGVVASTSAVGHAVLRNTAKRRLRELFRRHQAYVPPGTDLLLVARASVRRLEFHELVDRFVAACRQISGARRE